MKILILTGKFGMGHFSAAKTIKAQLEDQLGAEVMIVDLMQYILEEHSAGLYRAYGALVNRSCGIFNWLYKNTDKGGLQGKLPLEKTMAAAVAEMVETTGADLLIATHSASVMAASAYKRRWNAGIPLVTVITDVVSHSNWITPETDWYLAATPFSRQWLVQKGVAPERVLVCGIPVKPVFINLPRRKRRAGTRQLLIMGGGCGLLPKDKQFYEALNQLPGVETTILTGHNQALLAQLSGTYEHIRALDFTDEVPKFMAQADVVISKPGGLSVFEAIYAEKPLLLFKPKLEQEKRNGQFMADSGMALLLPNEGEAMAEAISRALADEVGLKRLERQMRLLKSQLDEQALVKCVAQYIRKEQIQC